MRKGMGRRWKAIALLAALLALPAPQAHASGEYHVFINNQELTMKNPLVMRNGRLLVPLREIGEAMECKVAWNKQTRTANLQNTSTIVSMQVGNPKIAKMDIDQQDKPEVLIADVAPEIINNLTYIPLRAFAQSLDAIINWDPETRTAMIVYGTTLQYAGNWTVGNFAGNGNILCHDSNDLTHVSFVSPESIDIAPDGTVYVADSGKIRKIKDGKSETVTLSPSYLTASALQCAGDKVYILTHEFQDEAGMSYYGIAQMEGKGNTAKGIFLTEAPYSKISDFALADDGTIYVLQHNVGVGKNFLGRLEPDKGTITVLCELDDGIKTLAVGPAGMIYLGNSVNGSIYCWKEGMEDARLFAGKSGNTKFIDGPHPMFFEPIQMEYHNNSLYVLDYDVIRRITLNTSGGAIESETIAGKVSLEKDPETVLGKASNITFAHSYLMDFAVRSDGALLLTDPKKAYIRVLVSD